MIKIIFLTIRNLLIRRKRFLKLYKNITDDMASGKLLTPKGDKYAAPTVRTYRSTAYRFKIYEKEYGKIYLEDINLQWAFDFISFQMEKGYTKNSIALTMGRLKAVLKRLYDAGISKYNGAGIPCAGETITSVFTSVEEMKALLELNLLPGLERVRDVFILHSFIGLRFGDLRKLLKNPRQFFREIGGNLFFELKTGKTGEVVVIPIGKVVKQILDKYNWDFGEPFSYQYYNLSIKQIARLAGITQDIVFSRTEGGVRVDKVVEKCELMSSHTARRTFATLAFLAGIPERSIMWITGHKTTQAFHRYICCSSLDAAIKISAHEFFRIELPITINLPKPEVLELVE